MPSSFSLLLRRTHMFLALFLSPWMAMYALSTLVFNHYPLFERLAGGSLESYVPEYELPYLRALPPNATSMQIAAQLRADLNLAGNLVPEDEQNEDGEFRFRLDSGELSAPRRLILIPSDHKVIFEKQPFRFANLLTRLHSRVGYRRPATRFAWAFSVDLAIFASVLWIFSGFWMWWELKAARRLGLFFALLGPLLFAVIWALG